MIRRLVALVLVLAVAAALLLALWPQLLDLQRSWPAAQLVSFRGAAAVVAAGLVVLMLIVGLVARPVRSLASSFAVLLLVFAAVSAGFVGARGLGRDDFVEAVPGDLTVVSWNTLSGAPGVDAVAKLAIDEGAEVVSLPETDADTAAAIVAAMGAAGLPMIAHTVTDEVDGGTSATSLLLSTALGDYAVAVDEAGVAVEVTPDMPSVVATPVSGVGPTIVAAHPHAPVPADMESWRDGLSALADVCRTGNVVMAGDFNATVDHMAGLGRAGGALGRCRDAGVATANGGVGTWPVDVAPLLGTPIDHVMATRQWLTTGFRVVTDLDGAGSDHRPLVAQLSPTGQ